MEQVDIVCNVLDNDYLEAMKPCGRADGLILIGELILLSGCDVLYDGDTLHAWVSARLPLRSRGTSRRLIFDLPFIGIFFYANMTQENFEFLSPRSRPLSLWKRPDVQRRSSTMSTSLALDAT